MPDSEKTSPSRVLAAPGFCWDASPAYLFDIDGTLLRSRDGIHPRAFIEGVRQVLGVELSLDNVPMAGNTDTAILAEACRQAGIDESRLAEHRQEILRATCDYVVLHRDALAPDLMPGIEDTLDHLTRKGALLGVATGNLETIGWTKLEKAGLRKWFRFGGFSDRFTRRNELVASATAHARQLLDNPAAQVCIVGDTPRDIEAARFSRLPVISVATGRYSFDQLAALAPDLCASSLADLLAASAAH